MGGYHMRKLSIHHLKPGMTAAENVLDFGRHLILEKNTVLTEELIEKLRTNQIIAVFVEDEPKKSAPAAPDVPSDSVAPPQTNAPADNAASKESPVLPDLTKSYSERIKQSEEFKAFKASYDKNLDNFKGVLNDIVHKNAAADINTLLHDSLDLISSSHGKISLLDLLQNMRDYDDSTYAHSMNVALISNVLAVWLKLSDEEVEMATACGLFHDIGKLKVPSEVIQKPSRLSREEYLQVRAHTVEGYKILKTMKMNVHVQNAALMHHERMDGTGYPLNLMGDQIDRYAALVSIADVYDAMTAKRVYRDALCPFEVIEIFEKEGFHKYDTSFLLPFLEHVVNTYLQNRCLLSDGRIATIVFVNKDKLSRPTVECEGKYLNLANEPDLKIAALL